MKWGYRGENGPSFWHMAHVTGTRQSPINIETDKNVIETDEALDDIRFSYVPENSTRVGNTGASWKVDVTPDGSSKDCDKPGSHPWVEISRRITSYIHWILFSFHTV